MTFFTSSPGPNGRFYRPLVAVLILTTVGLAACDSGGSDMDDEDEDQEPEIEQTFTVTVESIDSSYPYSDQNQIGVAYAIDGEVGRELTLERGATYAFELQSSVESGPEGFPHPFYFDETAEGQGTSPFSEGVQNAEAVSGRVTFVVPSSAPNSLFYECGNHAYMGGEIVIEDSTN